jgi:FkbM family methyltransferase
MPWRARLDLLRAEARRRIRSKDAYAVRYGPGTVYLSHADYGIDWESLKFVVADHAYPSDYKDAVVLDLGAHKGYYGAYAIAAGARTVLAYEPEAENVALLERAAATYRTASVEWDVRDAAVGATRGQAELHVMGSSWSHSLHPPDEWSRYEVGTQKVRIESMEDALADATAHARTDSHNGNPRRVVVKLNVEGEECGIVLGTALEAWEGVHEVFVEYHSWAPCTVGELTQRLASAGFVPAPHDVEPVLRFVASR